MNDDGFDRELRRAITAEAYSPPLTLDAQALRARLGAKAAARRTRLVDWALASAVALIVITGLAVFAGPPIQLKTGPISSFCEVSPVTSHGNWWKEIGGPNASFWFFSSEVDPLYATPYAWLITVRVVPSPSADAQIEMWADRIESGERIPALPPTDPRSTSGYPAHPQIPGGWYLMEQRFPVPGCWQLSAAIDGRVVGTATVDVRVGTAARLPVGAYMTSVAIADGPCFAFENSMATYTQTSVLRSWGWEMGESGDCTTRTSDVIAFRATIGPREDAGYDLVLHVPGEGGGTREVRIALYVLLGEPGSVSPLVDVLGGLTPLGGVVLSAGNASVFFNPVETGDPTFAPRR